MTFIDLCRANVFKWLYWSEKRNCDAEGPVSVECRALTKVFRRGRNMQPKSLAAVKKAMKKPLLRFVGRPHPDPSTVSVIDVEGVRCHAIRGPDPIVIIHGGGFVGGTWLGYAGYANAICELSQRGIVFVDYDTNANHKKQVSQVAKVLNAVNPTTAVADSAGGHLLLCAYEDYDVAASKKTILFSPVADPSCSSDSFKHNGWCYTNNICENGNPVGEAMFEPNITKKLLQSITTRKVKRVPPHTYVWASGNELFADDARYLGTLGATVDVSPALPGGKFHAWPLWDIPEANSTLCSIFKP